MENYEIAQALVKPVFFFLLTVSYISFLSQSRLRLASNLGEDGRAGKNTLLALPSRVCVYFSRSYIFR